MSWRLIIDEPRVAPMHMAVDEVLSLSVRKGGSPPVLRLYSWNAPAVTLGYFQKIEESVNLAYCRDKGIEVTRRITGGRAIVHGLDELTYSFSSSFEPPFHMGLHTTYRSISEAFVTGFRKLGIDAAMGVPSRRFGGGKNPVCFQTLSFAEAAVDGRKIIGSAQKRWPDGLLQQGSIPLTLDLEMLYNALRFESQEIKERARAVAMKKMAGLKEFAPHVTREQIEAAVIAGFEAKFGIRFSSTVLAKEEEERSRKLMSKIYGAREWNWKR